MNTVDPFGRTDRLDDAMLEALVKRFEARGENPRFACMLTEYLDAMEIDHADAVLDMGCGTGLAARAIASRPGFTGTVAGVDLSPHLIAAAERFARDEGVSERTTFRAGDTRSLDVADGTYDAVVAHTLLSHVEDPQSVVNEAARVLRPGGMLGIFDGDYASLTFGHADPVQGKSCDEALIRAVVTNPRIMRDMPRLLREAGFDLHDCFPHVLSEVGKADFWASAIEAYRRLMPRAKTMTEQEADTWAANLRRDSDSGGFFGSSNYYAYVARRL